MTKAEAINATNRVRPTANIAARVRNENRQQTQDSRFKIVNCYRTLDTADGESAANNSSGGASSSAVQQQNITVVDIEKHTEQSDPMTNHQNVDAIVAANVAAAAAEEDDTNYVYDLYMPDTNQLNDFDYNLVDNLLRFVINGHICVTSTMI